MNPETAPSKVDLQPLLVDIAGLAKLLARSVASLYRDEAAGRLPAGLRLGGSKRWRYDEICDWVRAGAPNRVVWERLATTKGTAEPNG